MAIKYIPDGVRTITPLPGRERRGCLLDFILRGLDNVTRGKDADGQKCRMQTESRDSHKLGHARTPEDAMQAMLYLYVPDCDAAFRKALSAGGAVRLRRVRTRGTATGRGCVKESMRQPVVVRDAR